MILDGTMVIIAMLALTFMHPGRSFGRVWREADFTFWVGKGKKPEVEIESSGAEGSVGNGVEEKGGRVEEVGLQPYRNFGVEIQ